MLFFKATYLKHRKHKLGLEEIVMEIIKIWEIKAQDFTEPT